TYVEAARVFADHILRSGSSTSARLEYAYRQALSRPPRPPEAKLLGDLLDRHLKEYASDPTAASEPVAPGHAAPPTDLAPLHAAPQAKRGIHLYIARVPPHVETLDYKPKLAEMNGKPMPESFTKGQPIAQLQNQALKCLEPQHKFEKFGKSAQEICSL